MALKHKKPSPEFVCVLRNNLNQWKVCVWESQLGTFDDKAFWTVERRKSLKFLVRTLYLVNCDYWSYALLYKLPLSWCKLYTLICRRISNTQLLPAGTAKRASSMSQAAKLLAASLVPNVIQTGRETLRTVTVQRVFRARKASYETLLDLKFQSSCYSRRRSTVMQLTVLTFAK